MPGECFNCVANANQQYEVVIDGDCIVEAGTLCDGCVTDFRDGEWVDINGPVTTTAETDD